MPNTFACAFRVPSRWLFVRAKTSSGVVGWGEATLEGHTQAVDGAVEDLTSRFVECIMRTTYKTFSRPPTELPALSGLDITLWDIEGKTLGVPVWRLLGAKVRDGVKVYGWIGGNSPNDVYNATTERKPQQLTTVKMNATILINAVALIQDVKRTGLDLDLHKGMAKQLAKLPKPLIPLFIEGQKQSPTSRSTLVSTPIALGEPLFTRGDFSQTHKVFMPSRPIECSTAPNFHALSGIDAIIKLP
ncbi:hypothetical protein BDN71DRAFT_1512299 [Pleurotus eryngii]|uniref:Mandelate racemase/muconate lactonizing enzyme N-terminal domain-containing protein n=1 Tax=Pleurotus eryngii TaxID=5323 RepID=A0A9P6DA14_PLEER|nr:hypothetical protein BDN71DRAFT_1512299 [Pleurotus eryngii]